MPVSYTHLDVYKRQLLKKAVRVVAKGSGMPQFFNDEAIIAELEKLGISHQDAMDYAIVGCVELTTQGNNLGWSDAATVSYTHLDVYKRQGKVNGSETEC